jgi:hypothetical protein
MMGNGNTVAIFRVKSFYVNRSFEDGDIVYGDIKSIKFHYVVIYKFDLYMSAIKHFKKGDKICITGLLHQMYDKDSNDTLNNTRDILRKTFYGLSCEPENIIPLEEITDSFIELLNYKIC